MKNSIKTISLFILLTTLFQFCEEDKPNDCEDFEPFIEQVGNNVLKANAKYGHSPYEYKWSTGSDMSQIIVNSSGTYSCTVTDEIFCEKSVSFDYTYVAGCTPSTVTDGDGNAYDVVSIGNQCWMLQNLRVGAGFPEVSDSLVWGNVDTPAWCYYQNNDFDQVKHGRLYNWAAVNTGNLCPAGWHIATLDEWNELITYLGGQNIAGGKMKSVSDWKSPNTSATNSSGFTALASGYRGTNGAFWDADRIAAYWTASSYTTDPTQAWAVTLSYQSALAAPGWSPKKSGYSCRCVKD